MKETHITSFSLPDIMNLEMLNWIARTGYQQTGNKFDVNFSGSKGYLCHFSISCEGKQEEDNRLYFYNIRNQNVSLKKKLLNIYWSEEKGIRLSLGKDEPRTIDGKDDAQISSGRWVITPPEGPTGDDNYPINKLDIEEEPEGMDEMIRDHDNLSF